MSRFLQNPMKNSRLATMAIALTATVAIGCSAGPSQKELDALEETRQAMAAAEKAVSSKRAEKSRLERKLAEKKAEKKAVIARKQGTKENLADDSSE